MTTIERERTLKNYRPAPPPPPRRVQPLRILVRLLGLAVLLAVIAFGYTYVSNKAFRQTLSSVIIGANPKAAFGQNAVTLLILGKDEDRDHRDRVMETNARSDTIILSRLDFNTHRIDMLSIPRDTRVHVPGTRGYRKINAAHAIGGWEKTAETIQDFLGVAPDKVVVVDYDMLRKVIDDLGGVMVKVDKQLDYDDDWGNLHIHLKPGMQRLNGAQAMGFVRFRHSNEGAGDSDFVRIERQQALLQAIKATLKEPTTWMRVPRVLETVRREMRGTLTYSQLVALAAFARNVPKTSIAMHVLPSRPGRVYVYPDRDAARALAARLFPASGEVQATEPSVEETPRLSRTRSRRARRPSAPVAVVSKAPESGADDATGGASPPASEAAREPVVVEEPSPEPQALIDAAPAVQAAPVPEEPADEPSEQAAPQEAPKESPKASPESSPNGG